MEDNQDLLFDSGSRVFQDLPDAEMDDSDDLDFDDWDYDDLSGYEDPEEAEKMSVHDRRKLSLCQPLGAYLPEQLQEQMESRFHTKFTWCCPYPKGETRGGWLILMEESTGRVVTETKDGQLLVLLSRADSENILYSAHAEASAYCIAGIMNREDTTDACDIRNRKRPPWRSKARAVRYVYDPEGMPACVYSQPDNSILWRRTAYREEALTWVFGRSWSNDRLFLTPEEIWHTQNRNSPPALVWDRWD